MATELDLRPGGVSGARTDLKGAEFAGVVQAMSPQCPSGEWLWGYRVLNASMGSIQNNQSQSIMWGPPFRFRPHGEASGT